MQHNLPTYSHLLNHSLAPPAAPLNISACFSLLGTNRTANGLGAYVKLPSYASVSNETGCPC